MYLTRSKDSASSGSLVFSPSPVLPHSGCSTLDGEHCFASCRSTNQPVCHDFFPSSANELVRNHHSSAVPHHFPSYLAMRTDITPNATRQNKFPCTSHSAMLGERTSTSTAALRPKIYHLSLPRGCVESLAEPRLLSFTSYFSSGDYDAPMRSCMRPSHRTIFITSTCSGRHLLCLADMEGMLSSYPLSISSQGLTTC